MNQQALQLYQRIQDFDLDDCNAKFPFSQKLAKENRWSAEYTQRAIEEYKKFAFLAVVAGHPVTPSEQVDRVWHLHLLYTRSYWEDFCPNVLQIHLHHNPTLGGSSEQSKYYNQYDRTLASYESFFGEFPPTDIWSPAEIRFGRDTRVAVVNTKQNWIISKPNLDFVPKFSVNRSISFLLLFGLALMVAGCNSLLSNPNNPLNFNGPDFLLFYICLASLSVLLGCAVRHFFQKSYRRLSEDAIAIDTYEAAYLANKDQQTIETAVLSLVKRGHLRPQPTTRTLEIIESLPDNSHPLERAIEEQIRRSKEFIHLRGSASVESQLTSIRARIRSLDLLFKFNIERSLLIQRLSALPIFIVLLLGIAKIGVGWWRGKPVEFLVIFCIWTAIIGYCFLDTPLGSQYQHRSPYGDRILAHLKGQNQHLNRPSDNPQELAFALFGIVVLSENALQGLRRVFSPPPPPRVVSTQPSRSTSSSSDGGGGGGGCGGGGCGGGCGGCGD
jgi:uncharacterized protein (TIGR04222 family)